MIKIALLTTDSREHFKDYANPNPYFGTAPEALLEGFKLLPDEVKVHVISCLQKAPVSSPKQLAENVYYHELHVPKIGWMKTGYLGCTLAIRRKLREIQPDIVHGQGTERDCVITAVHSGYPNVLTIHGNIAELARIHSAKLGSFAWLQAKLENWCLPRTAGVLCNSAYTDKLVTPRARQCWRVPNAVRSMFFSQAANETNRSVPIILNVGVICPRKRQVELLAVARKLHLSGTTNVRWRFVGQLNQADPYARRFAELIRIASEEGYAEHSGVLDPQTLIGLMDAASAMVHFPYEEAFGLVVAEAMARGLKLFGSDLGGIRDITSGIRDAILVPADDYDNLLFQVQSWLDAGAPRSPGSAIFMRERYNPARIAAAHLRIYRQVIRTTKGT